MGKGGDVQLPSTGTQLSTSLTNVHMANLAGNTLAEARIDCTVALRGVGWFRGVAMDIEEIWPRYRGMVQGMRGTQ